MQWTKETPTEVGKYWYYPESGWDEVIHVSIYRDRDVLKVDHGYLLSELAPGYWQTAQPPPPPHDAQRAAGQRPA